MNNDLNESLIKACKDGDLEEVKLLIEKGADLDAKDKDEITALMWASMFWHLDVVHYLFEHGAEVNARDEYDWTALRWAYEEKNFETAKYLLDKELKNERL